MSGQVSTRFAFYKGTSRPFNKFVAWKISGPYSHCEAVIGLNTLRRKKVYTCASASFSDGGVRFKDIDLKPEHWDVIEVPGIDPDKVLQYFEEHEGEVYDLKGLINFAYPVGHVVNGKFCSESCGASADIDDPHRFDPTQLAIIFERLGGVWIQGGPQWSIAA